MKISLTAAILTFKHGFRSFIIEKKENCCNFLTLVPNVNDGLTFPRKHYCSFERESIQVEIIEPQDKWIKRLRFMNQKPLD